MAETWSSWQQLWVTLRGCFYWYGHFVSNSDEQVELVHECICASAGGVSMGSVDVYRGTQALFIASRL